MLNLLWMDFVDGLVNNDKKYTKTAKKHPLGCKYLLSTCIQYKGVPTLPA